MKLSFCFVGGSPPRWEKKKEKKKKSKKKKNPEKFQNEMSSPNRWLKGFILKMSK